MNAAKIGVIAAFALLLGAPVLVRQPGAVSTGSAPALRLIVITPHNEQIRYEFARAFSRWHARRHGQQVLVEYNVPGGTSEIRRMLESQFSAAFDAGREPGGAADLVFGGGTFEHERLKRGLTVRRNGQEARESISAPVEFPDAWLQQTYGENQIADGRLYDPQKHWFGLALSGFGIVFNCDLLLELNVPEPRAWSDLCDPRLRGWVALVNPGQSGSIATAFDAILKRSGWNEGWRILRRAGANARYFSGSSLKPPIDVSQGNAAVGVSIDFYGRFQVQALREAGHAERVGYIDPPGGSTIDADPISMLRGAPHPELARRFIEFCLSEEGQALWQFPRCASGPVTAAADDALGPQRFELRRLPIVRSMYISHFERFIDKVNPFELATPMTYPDPNFRDFIAPVFAAMVMDTHADLKRAWAAIVEHPAYSQAARACGSGIVTADNASDETLAAMLRLFDAMPAIEGPEGRAWLLDDAASLGAVHAGWLRGEWAADRLWPREAAPADELRRRFAEYFRMQYRQIVRIGADAAAGLARGSAP